MTYEASLRRAEQIRNDPVRLARLMAPPVEDVELITGDEFLAKYGIPHSPPMTRTKEGGSNDSSNL